MTETCFYCGTTGGPFHLDHVVPRSRGGPDHPSNLVTACATCNTSKGDRLPSEWYGERSELVPARVATIEARVCREVAGRIAARREAVKRSRAIPKPKTRAKRDWTAIAEYGFVPSRGAPEIDRAPEESQIKICRLWLRECVVPVKHTVLDDNSYGHKHRVERWMDEKGESAYIANGAMIEAARREGFVMERTYPDSPNAYFNFEPKDDRPV